MPEEDETPGTRVRPPPPPEYRAQTRLTWRATPGACGGRTRVLQFPGHAIWPWPEGWLPWNWTSVAAAGPRPGAFWPPPAGRDAPRPLKLPDHGTQGHLASVSPSISETGAFWRASGLAQVRFAWDSITPRLQHPMGRP